MDIPVGVQVMAFAVYIAWSVGSLIVLLRISDSLEDIRKEIRKK